VLSYDYVMHGKVYKCEPKEDLQLAVLVSFGGLMMRLKGSAADLSAIDLDTMIFLLIKNES
jgi:DNA-directed RNA polymerase I, II, and III subunit RPABC3